MAKDKGKKSDSTKGKGGFAKPSEAAGGGDGWNLTEEAEGRLLLLTPLREEQVDTKDYGTKPVIIADVVVLDEKKPEKSEVHQEVYVWGGYLRGGLKSFIGEQRVLARLVRGTKKERGNFPWLFEDATEDDIEVANTYLESVNPFKMVGDADEDNEKSAKKKKSKK